MSRRRKTLPPPPRGHRLLARFRLARLACAGVHTFSLDELSRWDGQRSQLLASISRTAASEQETAKQILCIADQTALEHQDWELTIAAASCGGIDAVYPWGEPCPGCGGLLTLNRLGSDGECRVCGYDWEEEPCDPAAIERTLKGGAR